MSPAAGPLYELDRPPTVLTFPEFAAEFLNITPKRGGVTPFVLNEPQRRLDRIIEERRAAGRPVRLIILKARQMGMSTYSLGRMYHYATTREGVMAFLASYDDDSVKDLFERVRLMYDLAPAKPMLRYSNRTELDFSNPDRIAAMHEPGLQSRLRIGTAGRAKLGRSKTLRYLHLSEVAFWENAKRVLLGLEQALPDDPDTIEIIESTANGVGGEFFERWKLAENPETAGEWVAVFFAWFDFPEYSRELEGGVMHPVPPCAPDLEAFEREEQELVALFKLTAEQLNWRRWAIVNKCGNSLELFRQEYPATAMEAFLTSGRPIFNREIINARVRELTAEDLRRRAEGKKPRFVRGELRQIKGRQVFQLNPDADLYVYRFPQRGAAYVIGGDPCRGVSKVEDAQGVESDAAEWHVYDTVTWEQVAVYSARVDAVTFARMGYALGWFYNRAHVASEVNDHGHTVVVKLAEWNYPDLYMRHEFDTIGAPPVKKPGWETNKKTRPIWIDAVGSAINGRYARFNHLPFLEQCLTFVRTKEKPQGEADSGCHDDGVTATGIALAVMEHKYKRPAASSPFDPTKNLGDYAMVNRDLKRCVAAELERQSWRQQVLQDDPFTMAGR